MWDILIADDHELLREGLKPFLRALGDDAVVLEAASYDEARSVAAKASGLGLIVVDIGMPGMNGLW